MSRYNHLQVLEEYDAGDNRQRYYIWGNYIDELLVMNDDAGDNSDYFVCRDHLFSPQTLVDGTGAIVERYDYDAYGSPTIYTEDGDDDTWFTSDDTTATVSAIGVSYLFTGREYDSLDDGSLALQYSRARYYSGAKSGALSGAAGSRRASQQVARKNRK